MAQRIAAIDIGTVTCRLLVAEVGDCGMRQLHRESTIVNLGEGVDANGYLLDAAMARVDDCVAAYLGIVDEYSEGPDRMRVVAMATSASRDASNADDFAVMLERRGVHLTVIAGEREAALSFMGASAGHSGERLLVLDVGGGSTEMIAGIGGQAPDFKRSFNVGCRRVTERFLRDDPPTSDQMREAISWFSPQFEEFFAVLGETGFVLERIVAVAGTATSMVSIEQSMDIYDSSRVHGAHVSLGSLEEMSDRLSAMTLAQRRHVVGLQPDRAPVIVAGMLILSEIVRLAGASGFTVSESDILQGIVMDALQA